MTLSIYERQETRDKIAIDLSFLDLSSSAKKKLIEILELANCDDDEICDRLSHIEIVF